MPYATQADLLNMGFPATALGNLSAGQIAAELQAASDQVDTAIRGRYGNEAVPLLTWDSTITRATAQIAAFELMVVRGMKANGPDWTLFYTRKKDAEAFLDKVQRQQAHPLVTLANSQVAPQQPNYQSSSVIAVATGRVASRRGW